MNINRTAEVLADESLDEFLVVQDQFMTPTARFADIVLPACTAFEMYGIQDGWKFGDAILFNPKLVEPLAESKSDYQIFAELAERLGIGEAFTEGRDERQWVDYVLDFYRNQRFPDVPTVDEFEDSNIGAYSVPITEPTIAFADFRQDPIAHPLPTPSGKIEIFSPELYAMNQPDVIPPVPKYIQEWESPFSGDTAIYPLQAIGSHYMARVHSTHANNDWLKEAFPQRVFMNPVDAEPRGIKDGEIIRVFNDRGEIRLPCRITKKMMPGVIDIPQGAWWDPDDQGIDHGGSVNVLTSEQLSPLAYGNTQHTIMVQAAKVPGNKRS